MGSMTSPYSEEGRRDKTRGEMSSVANQMVGTHEQVESKDGFIICFMEKLFLLW